MFGIRFSANANVVQAAWELVLHNNDNETSISLLQVILQVVKKQRQRRDHAVSPLRDRCKITQIEDEANLASL